MPYTWQTSVGERCSPLRSIFVSLTFSIGVVLLIFLRFAVGNVAHNLTRNDQPRGGGHKGVAAGNLAALGTFAGRVGRADAMGAAADGHIINGGQCRLFGVYHLQVLDPALAQLGAHYAGQRADGGIVNIRNFQGGSIQLVARAHAADDGRARCLRLHDQFQLTLTVSMASTT